VKPLVFHLPLIGVLLIFGISELIDAGYLTALRNESTYGWWILVWYPLAALLALTQVVLWIRWIVTRGMAMAARPGMPRRLAVGGVLILAAAALGLFALRISQRWGLFGG